MEIGKLKEVELRNLWKHEQYDFSEWLSQNENIELLNDILGLTLTDISKEVYVGSYRCDLVAVDESSGIKVIIENQLENFVQTDFMVGITKKDYNKIRKILDV